jgi:hypothetical protein
VLGTVEKFESLCDVGHVYRQSEVACALPERLPGSVTRPQTLARKTVHRFAQADMAIVPQAFGGRGHVVIEPDRCPHILIVASVMLSS